MSILKVKDKDGKFVDIPVISGRPASIKVGEVKLLEPNSEPTIENVGTEYDAIFDFGIPRGLPGNGTGTFLYPELFEKPKINDVELNDNVSLSALGIQPKGYYTKYVDDVSKLQQCKPQDVVRTLGYYEPNDGGGALYLIREKTQDDVEDKGSIHFVGDKLVAELIVDDSINIKQYGIRNNDDCTQKLQSIINSYNNVVIEDLILNIDNTIDLHSNLKIDIFNSTINQLSTINQKNVFCLNKCNNVIINGNNSILKGQKPSDITQQAAIRIKDGSKNIVIEGLTLSYFGGDGFILEGTEINISKDLTIRNCVITNNSRNGISLIGGLDNIVIENCDINLSVGHMPQAGIDIETWKDTLFNCNIFIKNNKFSENLRSGIAIFENAKNIFIENNVFLSNDLNLFVNNDYKNKPQNAPTNINVIGNIFEGSSIYSENQLGTINIKENKFNSTSENCISMNFFDGILGIHQLNKNIENNSFNKKINLDGCYNLSIHNNFFDNVSDIVLSSVRTGYIKFYENSIIGYNTDNTVEVKNSSGLITLNSSNTEIYNNIVKKTQDTNNVSNFVYSDAASRKILVYNNNLNDTNFSLALYGNSWVGNEGIAYKNRDDIYLNMPMREFPTASSLYSGVILNKLDSGINNSYICIYDTTTSTWNWKKIIY